MVREDDEDDASVGNAMLSLRIPLCSQLEEKSSEKVPVMREASM